MLTLKQERCKGFNGRECFAPTNPKFEGTEYCSFCYKMNMEQNKQISFKKCEVSDCFNQAMKNSTFCSHFCRTRCLILVPGYCYCGWKLISTFSPELQKPIDLCPQNIFHNQVREYFISRGRVVEGMYVHCTSLHEA